MNLPFKRFLKKEKAAPPAALVATEPRLVLEKPASERFGKTVMPKSSRGAEPDLLPPLPRSSSLGDEPAAVPLPDAPAFVSPSAPPPARKPISLGQSLPDDDASTPPAPSRPAPRPISLGPSAPNEPANGPLTPAPVATIRLPMPLAGNQPPPIPSRPTIYPNGTGVPAIERVPASSGPSVPISLPSPFAPVPGRIKLPSLEPAATSAISALESAGPRMRLSLREALHAIPPFQLTGSIDHVPEEAKIELPFSLIKPQLATGKVEIAPVQFQAAMPEEFRSLLVLDEGGLPIPLPLAEVLAHLPNESLNLRADQEEIEIANVFETPFSQHAEEDAARLHVPGGPIAKGSAAEIAVDAPVANEPVARTPLQELFETDDELDAKAVVARVSSLSAIKACAIVFSDGLSLASDIPEDLGAEKLCAIAPEIARRLDQSMIDASLGGISAITIFYTKAPVSFFAHGNICLAVVHSADDLGAETRHQLNLITQELAQVFAQPPSLTPNA
jgi:predicted regulator of Ras-like GTPase activity (Roadblock/LC7/MglB family)